MIGTLKNIALNVVSKKLEVTFEVDDNPDIPKGLLSIEVKKHREKRSNNANALFWKYCQKLAQVHNPPLTKDDIYLKMLRDYGSPDKTEYILIQEKGFEMFKNQFRECEIVGTREVNGKELQLVACYYGSSEYDTKEFSVLLNGLLQECKDQGIETINQEEFDRCIEMHGMEYEKKN